MKRLQLTPQIRAWLEAALGPDVEITDEFAVFESISLNNQPLPGKRGTIHAGAVIVPTTLRAMVDHINGPSGSLPLMIDHVTQGAPKGRVFHAGLNLVDEGVELRTLFYIDPTEAALAEKVDNGTYDEVSVQFLAKQLLCSECGFDYRGEEATWENLLSLTCNEGHVIGENGVHVREVGLEQFIELSLVVRGAAKNPKIIGRSASKLAPELTQRLAAQGFEKFDGLICQASSGEDTVSNVDVNKLITDLSDARADIKVRDGSITALTGERDAALAAVTAAETARDAALAAQTAAETALAAASEGEEDNGVEDRDAAISYLGAVLTNVRTASGKEVGDLPKTVAELTAAIDEETSKLTAILPTGGRSQAAGGTEGEDEGKPVYSAFKRSN